MVLRSIMKALVKCSFMERKRRKRKLKKMEELRQNYFSCSKPSISVCSAPSNWTSVFYDKNTHRPESQDVFFNEHFPSEPFELEAVQYLDYYPSSGDNSDYSDYSDSVCDYSPCCLPVDVKRPHFDHHKIYAQTVYSG